MANDSLDIMRIGRDRQMEYKKYLENLRDIVSMVDSNYVKGVAKGEEIGLKKGEELVRKKGEMIKALKIAANMLKTGMEIELISKITGLNVNEIQKLKVKS